MVMKRSAIFSAILIFSAAATLAQSGPPYVSSDSGDGTAYPVEPADGGVYSYPDGDGYWPYGYWPCGFSGSVFIGERPFFVHRFFFRRPFIHHRFFFRRPFIHHRFFFRRPFIHHRFFFRHHRFFFRHPVGHRFFFRGRR
jgi:hypothetical protein